ncbi:MAG: hypothetical protein KAG34_03090 [Cocleimonas sp.]|nr:hypothetical protein [Cocleimonas sp.]
MRPLQEVEQLPTNADNEDLEDFIDLELELLEEEFEEDQDEANKKKEKNMKPHVIRRNVEDYLEQKALERSLRDVFDVDYLLD